MLGVLQAEIIYEIEKLDLRKRNKNERNGINESKIKLPFFSFNYYKAKRVGMHSMYIVHEKVKSMTIVSRIGRKN